MEWEWPVSPTLCGAERLYQIARAKVVQKKWQAITEEDLQVLASRDRWFALTTRNWIGRERRRAGLDLIESDQEYIQRRQRESRGIGRR